MQQYVVLDKAIGETPLMALAHWRSEHPELAGVPLAYAGRLDPMASGKLLILIGDECKRQKAYTGLDKEYEIEVLLDIGSDTGDILGIVDASQKHSTVDHRCLGKVLQSELGAHLRAYPAYSSKTVAGKPLFLHSLEGTTLKDDLPKHTENIYSISLLETSVITAKDLQMRITSLLNLAPTTTEPSKILGANFRIHQVRASWDKVFADSDSRTYTLLRLRVICGSGTYMRSLAGRIGESLGSRGLALSIHRNKIGRYMPISRWGFWVRKY